jgi:hypothetical protein
MAVHRCQGKALMALVIYIRRALRAEKSKLRDASSGFGAAEVLGVGFDYAVRKES